MKGISPVIATILMLMITIALAGTAYMYISGVFTAKTAVVLSVDSADCPGDAISVIIRNDGTAVSGNVDVNATAPNGDSGGSCTISAVNAGTSGTCNIDRPAATPLGYYRIRATSSGTSPVTGYAYCTTEGA